MQDARDDQTATEEVQLTGEQILDTMIKYASAMEPKVESGDECPYEKQFFSIGFVCQSLQMLPGQVRELAKSAGVRLAMVQNDVPMYDAHGLLGLTKHLRDLRDRKNKAPNN